MKKVTIKYDPYDMKTQIIVDGKNVEKNKHCDSNLKNYLSQDTPMPMQAWIDPNEREGWKGLLFSLCQMGDKKITIEFVGREKDYLDLQNSLNTQNIVNNCAAELTYLDLKKRIPDDDEMKKNIDQVVSVMLDDKFSKIVKNSGDATLIEKYEKLQDTYHSIDEKEFRIVFTGTYSSGKSSVINAIIGKNILPTASGTCTNKICRVVHDGSITSYAVIKYKYGNKIKEVECVDEKDAQEKILLIEDGVETFEIFTDLTTLYPKGVDDSFRLVVIDTPGTDSAPGNDTQKTDEARERLTNKSHIELTQDVLLSKSKEMVILISDDRLEADNIVDLMEMIEESSEDDDGAFNDRFLFVMNMCDSIQYSNEGETLSNSVKNFIANIRKVPNSNRIRNIVNPRVFPVTSGVALAVINGYTNKPPKEMKKTKQAELYGYYEDFCDSIYYLKPDEVNSDIDEDVQADANYCLEKESAASLFEKHHMEEELSGVCDVERRVLIHSGIPVLQNAISEYLVRYAYPMKVRDLLQCFEDILTDLNAVNSKTIEEFEEAKKEYGNAADSKKETLSEEAEAKKEEKVLIAINSRLKVTKEKIDMVSDEVPEINNIRAKFTTMKSSIAAQIGDSERIEKTRGDAILDSIGEKIDMLIADIKKIVLQIKVRKKESVDELYDEFISSLSELREQGLLSDGSFNLTDTVEYKKIINKESFINPDETSEMEKNKKKSHVEVDFSEVASADSAKEFFSGIKFGIGRFFQSIGDAWETRKEPNLVEVTYIDIKKYYNDNIEPVSVEIDKYVRAIKQAYSNDISLFKNNAKEKVDAVSNLVLNQGTRIHEIHNKAVDLAADEKKFTEEMDRLSEEGNLISGLVEKISHVKM